MDTLKISHTVKHKLPSFELSYEQLTHKKVNSDVCISLPCGTKTIVWFTVVGVDYLCISIPLYKNQLDISKSTVRKCCFTPDLCYGVGTLVLGVEMNTAPILYIYDVAYYKGYKINPETTFKSKIEMIVLLLKNNIKNNIAFKEQLSFCLPEMASSYEKVIETVSSTPYAFLFVNLNQSNFTFYFLKHFNKNPMSLNTNTSFLFLIKENNEYSMIYDLYVIKNGKEYNYCKANVNTLGVSNMLYKLFNKNKKSSNFIDNLDAIEESDEEDDTLSKNDDVKECYVYCIYNALHKSWNPIKIVSKKETGIVDYSTVSKFFVK